MSLALPAASNSLSASASAARLSALALAGLAAGVFLLASFSPKVLGDGDTWSHVATGEWILAHGGVPRVDPFSYTMAGAPWTAHEWLSEVLFALAYRAGGWSGVVLITALAAATATLILGLRVARDLTGVALLVVALLGVGLTTGSLLARPHILALPILAAWGVGLMAARDAKRAPPIALALLMSPWSNLHGGFAFGLALIAPFGLEAILEAPGADRLRAARDWGLFAFAALAAAAINPYGVEALLFPLRLLGVQNLTHIVEWAPEDFSRLGPTEIALLALIGFALTRPVRLAPIRALLLIGLVHMALQHSRHALILGAIAPILLAAPLAEAIGERARNEDGPRIARVALVAAAIAALALAGLRLALPLQRVDDVCAPLSALKAIPAELRGKPMLNDYRFGGYLIFSQLRPFIDGRADMFGDAMLSSYGRIAGGDPGALDDALRRYDVAWTMFSPRERVVATLDHTPGWRRLYADDVAVVHVRDDAAPAAQGLRGAAE